MSSGAHISLKIPKPIEDQDLKRKMMKGSQCSYWQTVSMLKNNPPEYTKKYYLKLIGRHESFAHQIPDSLDLKQMITSKLTGTEYAKSCRLQPSTKK